MPYQIIESPVPDRYYVVDNKGKYYSTTPLTLARAKKQLTALNISLAREHGHLIPKPGHSRDDICMAKSAYLAEHKRLIKLLTSVGKEAKEQQKELKERGL